MKKTLLALLLLTALSCKKDDDCGGTANITLFNNILESVTVTVDGASIGTFQPGEAKEVKLEAGERRIVAHPSSGAAAYNRTRTIKECEDRLIDLK